MSNLAAALSGLEIPETNTVCFISHHKAGAGKDARALKTELCRVFGTRRVFLDSDEANLDLNSLLKHVRVSECVVFLQTKDALTRPYVIGELAAAFEADIAVCAVNVRGTGYDFEAMAKNLNSRNFALALESANPGSTQVLMKQNIDVEMARKLLASKLPQLIATELDLNANKRIMDAQIATIAEAILKSISDKRVERKTTSATIKKVEIEKSLTMEHARQLVAREEANVRSSMVPTREQIYKMTEMGDGGSLIETLIEFGESIEEVARVGLWALKKTALAGYYFERSNCNPRYRLAVAKCLKGFGTTNQDVSDYGCSFAKDILNCEVFVSPVSRYDKSERFDVSSKVLLARLRVIQNQELFCLIIESCMAFATIPTFVCKYMIFIREIIGDIVPQGKLLFEEKYVEKLYITEKGTPVHPGHYKVNERYISSWSSEQIQLAAWLGTNGVCELLARCPKNEFPEDLPYALCLAPNNFEALTLLGFAVDTTKRDDFLAKKEIFEYNQKYR